jgi:hypothetical protein
MTLHVSTLRGYLQRLNSKMNLCTFPEDLSVVTCILVTIRRGSDW